MPKRYNWYNIFIHIMLVGLSVSVILLINKNKSLSEQLKVGSIEQLKDGEVFQNFQAFDLDGNEVTVDFTAGKNKLLFIFTTTCPFCTKNIPSWKELYEEKRIEYEIIGIGCDDMEEIKKYSEANELPYKVLIPKENEFRNKNKISGVPQTIYLNKDTVSKTLLGVLKQN